MGRRDPNQRRRRVVGLLVALAIVGVSGCGGDDDADSEPADVEATNPDTADTGDAADSGDTTDAGDAGDAGGGSDGDAAADAAGDDFPIPAPDGVVLDALVDAGIQTDGQRQLYYPDDDVDRLVAFYDDWTGQNGDWAKTEAGGTVVYQRLDGAGLEQISNTPEQDPGAQADGPLTFVLLVAGA